MLYVSQIYAAQHASRNWSGIYVCSDVQKLINTAGCDEIGGHNEAVEHVLIVSISTGVSVVLFSIGDDSCELSSIMLVVSEVV